MNKRPSKTEVREQINKEVEDFLRLGGEVKEMARGETGLVNGQYHSRSVGFEKPKGTSIQGCRASQLIFCNGGVCDVAFWGHTYTLASASSRASHGDNCKCPPWIQVLSI